MLHEYYARVLGLLVPHFFSIFWTFFFLFRPTHPKSKSAFDNKRRKKRGWPKIKNVRKISANKSAVKNLIICYKDTKIWTIYIKSNLHMVRQFYAAKTYFVQWTFTANSLLNGHHRDRHHLMWIKERVPLHFIGCGLIWIKFKLWLVYFHNMNYLYKVFHYVV